LPNGLAFNAYSPDRSSGAPFAYPAVRISSRILPGFIMFDSSIGRPGLAARPHRGCSRFAGESFSQSRGSKMASSRERRIEGGRYARLRRWITWFVDWTGRSRNRSSSWRASVSPEYPSVAGKQFRSFDAWQVRRA
jgi:hypothetical protein